MQQATVRWKPYTCLFLHTIYYHSKQAVDAASAATPSASRALGSHRQYKSQRAHSTMEQIGL